MKIIYKMIIGGAAGVVAGSLLYLLSNKNEKKAKNLTNNESIESRVEEEPILASGDKYFPLNYHKVKEGKI